MTAKGWFCFLSVALGALTETTWGQKASGWRVYRVADGLPESACMAVTLSSQGKVLVRHATMPVISELDGYTVETLTTPETGDARAYTSPGGKIWSVNREGLQEYWEGQWLAHPVRQIAEQFRSRAPRTIDPVPCLPVRQGTVVFLLPEGLFQYNADNPTNEIELLRAAGRTGLGAFAAMSSAKDGGLWISGTRGVAKVPGPVRNLRADAEWREFLLTPAAGIINLQEPHEGPGGEVVAVAESSLTGQKLIVRLLGDRWSIVSAGAERLRQAWPGPDGMIYATSIQALFQAEAGKAEVSEVEDLSARRYSDLALEPGGAFWLATSEGVFRYAPLTWRSHPTTGRLNSPVRCLTTDSAGRLWFVAGNALHLIENDEAREFAFPATSLRGLQATSDIFPLKNGLLALVAETPEGDDDLFAFNLVTGGFIQGVGAVEAERFRALGVWKTEGLLAQRWRVSEAEVAGGASVEVWDGSTWSAFGESPPSAGVGNRLRTLFAAQDGDIWVSGEHGTAWFHDRKWKVFSALDQTAPQNARCFIELADGKIWCATADKVWEFDGKEWSSVRRGFDRINAMIKTRDGSIWVAANTGLHRWIQGTWVENGVDEGLPSAAVRALGEDLRGRLWAGTTRGLSLYHPEADPDPPQTKILPLSGQGKSIPEGTPVTLAFVGLDRWKFTPRERLLYSYRFDDKDWSPYGEAASMPLPELSAGKHFFQVRGMDRNCNVEAKPAQIEFSVVAPWYKETRLVLITLAGVSGAVFFAALAFNRHRRLVRSYAEVERKVAERTKELELANRELLHSQKMTALGTLAAGIAHDFNNILSIIKGSAQIIEDSLDNPNKVQTRLDRIKTVVEQGSGIVKAMLGFSRESGAQPSPCDLNAVVDDTVRLLGDRFLHEVEVRVEPAPDLPLVPCARDFLQQMLLNFLFNAAESMNGRKQVILSTRLLEKAPADLVLPPAAAGQFVAVSVKDFGCGITPEVLPRIFEPFFTTKALSARRGTGLGLSMVYELAKKMEAGLAVESVPDQGSTFTVILPVRPPAESDPAVLPADKVVAK